MNLLTTFMFWVEFLIIWTSFLIALFFATAWVVHMGRTAWKHATRA